MGKWLVLALVTLVAIVGRAADNSDSASQQRRHGNRRAQPSAVVAGNVTINELDTDTHEGVNDTAEFIELYDGGVGNHDLSGLTLVLYRGDESVVYLAESLDGEATDALGYYMIGAVGMPGVDFSLAIGTIRDDQGAVAIYAAPEGQFPINSPVTTEDLVDALVYDQQGGEEPSAELMSLLLAGQAPLYEDTGGSALTHSSQRCPEGESPRTTELFILNIPTPDGTNNCVVDVAPEVVSVFPAPDAADVATDVEITVSFSEPVTLGAVPLEVVCTESDLHDYTVTGSDSSYQFSLETPLLPGESCVATIFGEEVSDTDLLDPPDHLEESSYSWHFSVAAVIADWIVINELDADTPGVDTAEFIELYDGGSGTTPLTGLVMVLYNGDTDTSYSVMDLSGFETNNDGYFVAGNESLVPDLVFSDAKLQNGTDAVAIYSGSTSDFPNGTPVTTENLIDAVVYGIPNDASDELLALLVDGQLPADEDGQGNACDADIDGDGVLNGVDNCPMIENPDQLDTDGDGAGDVCDEDDDNDTVTDGDDNCPLNANTSQLDTDNDGLGNVCDPDDDNDGVADSSDNCVLDSNSNQDDLDGDGIGVGIQIGQGLVFRNPAAKKVISEDLLAGFVVNLDADVLAEVLQRDLCAEAGAEVPDLVRPTLELQIVRDSPLEGDGFVLGAAGRFAAGTRVAALTMLDHFGRAFERAHLAHPGHVAPVPLDAKLEVLIWIKAVRIILE